MIAFESSVTVDFDFEFEFPLFVDRVQIRCRLVRLDKSLICDPRKVVELEKNHHLHRKMRVDYFSGVQTRGGF